MIRRTRHLRRLVPAVAVAPAALVAATAVPASAAWPWEKPPPAPCGGAVLAKPGGGTWTCSWYDEFNGSSLDRTKWVPQQTAYSSFTTGVECFMDSTKNVSVGSGSLRLIARKEAAPFTCVDPAGNFTTRYTAGSVSTFTKFTQAYGRWEIRAKFIRTTKKGLHSALWMWPEDPMKYGHWPYAGEIDIAEVYSALSDRAIPYVHYVPDAVDWNVTNNYCMISNIDQFHTYVMEWTPIAITISYDGKVCISDQWNPAAPLVRPQPFDQPFMTALTQGFGTGKNAFDPATTPLPATTTIDYVRVWK